MVLTRRGRRCQDDLGLQLGPDDDLAGYSPRAAPTETHARPFAALTHCTCHSRPSLLPRGCCKARLKGAALAQLALAVMRGLATRLRGFISHPVDLTSPADRCRGHRARALSSGRTFAFRLSRLGSSQRSYHDYARGFTPEGGLNEDGASIQPTERPLICRCYLQGTSQLKESSGSRSIPWLAPVSPCLVV